MQRITIDVVSDVVCPWCYLGKARLELAIAQIQDEIGVDVNWRPYQLNPDYPPEGVDHQKALAAKLGGKENMDRAHAQLTKLGAEVGIAFDFAAVKVGPNTLDAHRLSHWAAVEGREVQNRVVDALFKANFEEGRNVGDRQVLLDIAEASGLDRAVVNTLLSGEADKDTVRDEISAAQQMGVNGVPFFIIDQRYAVSGAQPVDEFANALRQIAATKQDEQRNLN
ncbi:DsbA family oxidoreductase [Rhizobium sp. RU36D]|uniref:DsbA family oxidoreductase n=1 Tax=Rhizobium sp. RU36D TaxID=1907415 RepID=UPI0009D8146B|nr:DsbA family oxidoreductase [Rhizobium sp. RU36D]SMC67750.1 Predicted dithiol-disulfide isomerase, DsbA family [Rhizobium sp. RU36D]